MTFAHLLWINSGHVCIFYEVCDDLINPMLELEDYKIKAADAKTDKTANAWFFFSFSLRSCSALKEDSNKSLNIIGTCAWSFPLKYVGCSNAKISRTLNAFIYLFSPRLNPRIWTSKGIKALIRIKATSYGKLVFWSFFFAVVAGAWKAPMYKKIYKGDNSEQ